MTRAEAHRMFCNWSMDAMKQEAMRLSAKSYLDQREQRYLRALKILIEARRQADAARDKPRDRRFSRT
jgi:hypothetical protein